MFVFEGLPVLFDITLIAITLMAGCVAAESIIKIIRGSK